MHFSECEILDSHSSEGLDCDNNLNIL